LSQILSLLDEKQKLLLILDNLNCSQDEQCIVEFLNTLTHECKNVHVIFGTNFYIKDIDNMRVKRLSMLTKDQSFELFLKKIPC